MRLIDADKAKAELLRIARDIHDCCGFYDGLKAGYQSAADRLDTMPVVEERKHGHWIEHSEHPIGDCSVCGERVPIYSGSKKYKVKLIETYAFNFEVEANNRVEAEAKAKDYVNNYREDDFFACSAASYVQGVFKIIPKT